MRFALDLLLITAGLACGHLLTARATRHALLQSRLQGIEDGRSESAWETQGLRLRVQRLEGQLRRIGVTQSNGVRR